MQENDENLQSHPTGERWIPISDNFDLGNATLTTMQTFPLQW